MAYKTVVTIIQSQRPFDKEQHKAATYVRRGLLKRRVRRAAAGESLLESEHLEDRLRHAVALDQQGLERIHAHAIFDEIVCRLADQDLIVPGVLLQASGVIHAVADGRVVLLLRVADIADHGFADVDADAIRQALAGWHALAIFPDRFLRRERRAHGA